MNVRTTALPWILVGLAALLPPAARAQAPQPGQINGHVTDETGANLPGAQVTLRADGVSRVVGTDEHGRFAFDQLSPAVQYTVTAQLPGFGTTTRDGIIVPPAGSISISLLLDPGCLRWGPPLTAQASPLEDLLSAVVAHVRIAEDAHDLDVMRGRSCARYAAAPATILAIVASPRDDLRLGTAVNVYTYRSLKGGDEYIAFLKYDPVAGHYLLDDEPHLLMKVNAGRVDYAGAYRPDGSLERLGVPERAPIDLALSRLRETRATHTRYRPYGEPGSEAPLEALANRTGWFELGGLRGDGDVWIDWTPEGKVVTIARPFDLVGATDPSRPLPRRGDRIRLHKGGIIRIQDFWSRGEARRERPPTAWSWDVYTVNLTGTRVDAGREYTIADVVVDTLASDVRYVWVRLVAD